MGKEQPARYYDAIYTKAKKYNRHYTGVRWLPMFEVAAAKVKGNILEIGCGVGQFANLLHDLGVKRYTGIDFSKEAIDRCKRLGLIGYDFFEDDIYTCFEYEIFDTIVALEVFEHINDLKVLSFIPAGKNLVISLPTFNNEAHLIWFDNADQIIERYKGIISIDRIERISDWFIFSGKKI